MNKEKVYGSNPASSNVSSITRNINLDDFRRFPIPQNDEVLVCPIGGVSEIGMNWTLYGHAGRWLLVDAGISFCGEIAAVEGIFPDPDVLAPILSRLDGLIVTHSHEDHIGAIHRAWDKIRCPIYATPFAAQIISGRLMGANLTGVVDVVEFAPGDSVRIGPFEIDTVSLTHSTVECVGLLLKTSVGNVFHTGDWKFDPDPVLGSPVDKDRLAEIGRAGVLAMVSDSTNAARTGKTTSEGALLDGFRSVMRDHRGMIVISCFASNVARMATVLRAARESGRYVVLAGRSMDKSEKIARYLGILDGYDRPVHPWEIAHCDVYQRVVLCTGTQGEENAALSKMSRGELNRLPPLAKGDIVIHSARAIPGNESALGEVLGNCMERGAEIIIGDYKGLPLHATGHCTSTEMIEMYGLIRPKFAIPVHGGPEQLSQHAALAEGCGVQAFTPTSGGVMRVRQDGIEMVSRIEVGLICQYATGPGEPPEFGPWNEDVREALLNPPLAVAVG